MTSPLQPTGNREIVRKTTLAQEGQGEDYSHLTPEQRVLMVWPLTQTAWRFKDPHGIQSRFPRRWSR
jgi:hypothetical protein